MKDLFLAHLVGHHDQQPVTLLRRHQREAEAGVAGGRFDDQRAGLDFPCALGGLDHGERHAVLDRAAGVLVFQLEEEARTTRVEALRLD